MSESSINTKELQNIVDNHQNVATRSNISPKKSNLSSITSCTPGSEQYRAHERHVVSPTRNVHANISSNRILDNEQ